MDTVGIFWIVFWSVALVVVVVIARHTHTSLLFSTKKQNNYPNKNNTDSKIVDNVTEIQKRRSDGIILAPSNESGNKVDYKTTNQNPEDGFQHSSVSVPPTHVKGQSQ